MNRGGSGEQASLLREATYANLRRALRECPDPVYRLRAAWLAPCALGESHVVNGSLQSVTLIYGSWDTDQPHVRVTTWRDLPGEDFLPDTPAELLAAAASEPAAVDIAGDTAQASLVRLPSSSWLLRVRGADLHLIASGHGLLGDLSFVPVADLEAEIDARRTVLSQRS